MKTIMEPPNQSIWQAKILSHTMLTSEKKQVTLPPTQPILECWNAGPMHFAEQISLVAFFSCRPRPPKKAWSIPLNCETPLVQKKGINHLAKTAKLQGLAACDVQKTNRGKIWRLLVIHLQSANVTNLAWQT